MIGYFAAAVAIGVIVYTFGIMWLRARNFREHRPMFTASAPWGHPDDWSAAAAAAVYAGPGYLGSMPGFIGRTVLFYACVAIMKGAFGW